MPETVGFFILDAVGIEGLSASTAAIVGNVALSAAAVTASIALNAFLPKPQSSPQDGQIITRQPLPDRRRSYGYVKLAGPLMFSETDSGRHYQIIALNTGEIDSFQAHDFNALNATLDSNGNCTNLYLLRTNDGATPMVVVQLQRGTDTDPSFPGLEAIFPGIWTSAHQGKGIAKALIITAQPPEDKFTQVYPGGQPPIYRAACRAAKVWDPRDPAQNRNDKTTWVWSSNPVLHALDYHRHKDAMGLAVYDDVFFTDTAIIEDWIPCADICDEAVPLKDGGFGARYVCAGGHLLSELPKDVLPRILSTCDGQTYMRADGAMGIRVGKTIAPTITITDEHIVGYEGFRNGPPSGSLVPVNTITAKYTDYRNLDFQQASADPWVDQAALDAAGRAEARQLDLTWCSEHPQARRLMKLAYHRANPKWAGKVYTDLDGLRAWNERYIALVIPELGIDGDSFELTGPPEFNVVSNMVTLTVASLEQAAFDWDPETEEGTAPSTADNPTNTDTIDDPTGVGVTSSPGASVIAWAWNPSTRFDAVAEAQYSVHGSANWFNASVSPAETSAATPPLTTGNYDVQVRFAVGSNDSGWVPLLNIAVS